MCVNVIGCGAVGAATASVLTSEGTDVIALDRFGIPNSVGSSHGRSRIFHLAFEEGKMCHRCSASRSRRGEHSTKHLFALARSLTGQGRSQSARAGAMWLSMPSRPASITTSTTR